MNCLKLIKFLCYVFFKGKGLFFWDANGFKIDELNLFSLKNRLDKV